MITAPETASTPPAPGSSVLILGASARAAAQSALRAGWIPRAADLFADLDLRAIAPVERIPAGDYLDGLELAAARAPASPWFYTGSLENTPELVDRIAATRPLWGNGGDVLRSVRDPIAVHAALTRAGLSAPAVRSASEEWPTHGEWLVKPLASSAGRSIRPWVGDIPPEHRSRLYLQATVRGESLSAIFARRDRTTTLLGVTRQLLGTPSARSFGYRGGIAPWPISSDVDRRLREIGDVLGGAFGLGGIFGVDLILRDDEPWPVEVNPRYTAAVELLEWASGSAALIANDSLPVIPNRFVAKMILFAAEPCQIGRISPSPIRTNVVGDPPEIADVPTEGTFFRASDPILTVFAVGSTPDETLSVVAERERAWRGRLSGIPA